MRPVVFSPIHNPLSASGRWPKSRLPDLGAEAGDRFQGAPGFGYKEGRGRPVCGGLSRLLGRGGGGRQREPKAIPANRSLPCIPALRVSCLSPRTGCRASFLPSVRLRAVPPDQLSGVKLSELLARK